MNVFSRNLEDALLSDSWLSVLILPVLAAVFLALALIGAGVMGDPAIVHETLKDSHEERSPKALEFADRNYGDWGGPTPQMSETLQSAIIANLREASTKPDFEGESFVFSPDIQLALKERAQEGEAQGLAGDPASQGEATSDDGATTEESASPPNPMTASLEEWTQVYWCDRYQWNDLWLDEIVRPLVARGVGGCSTWDQFSARSPLISYFSGFWGVIAFFALCLVALLFAFMSFLQLPLREAYRLQYRSSQFPS